MSERQFCLPENEGSGRDSRLQVAGSCRRSFDQFHCCGRDAFLPDPGLNSALFGNLQCDASSRLSDICSALSVVIHRSKPFVALTLGWLVRR